jgi:hypothetical protein
MKHKKVIGTFLILFCILLVINLRILDPDFGWHLQSGNYILANGIPSHDVFTYTAPTFPWIDHEWLNDIFISFLFTWGGFTLVAVIFSAVWAVGILIASRLYKLSVIIIAIVPLAINMTIRPVAWSFLLFALTERLLESKRPGAKLFLPLLICLWANLHGSFALGIVIIFLHKIVKKNSVLWTTIIASVAATFVNPYGPRIYIEVFRHLTNTELHTRINQWQSLILPEGFIWSTVFLIAIYFALKDKINWREIAIPAVLGAAFIKTVWYFMYFIAGSLRYFEAAVEKLQEIVRKRYSNFTVNYFSIVIPAVFFIIPMYQALLNPPPYPEKIAAYLEAHTCPGNVFNAFDYGGYLIWKSPHSKLFIDGRMPTWKENGKDYMGIYLDTIAKPDMRRKIFSEYSIKCVVYQTSRDKDFIADLQKENWQTILTEPGSILLEKQ